MIHRKKNRPALQRRDILTVFLVPFVLFSFVFLFLFCLFHREFAELFFHPVFSGSVHFSILHSSVLFKTLLFTAFC